LAAKFHEVCLSLYGLSNFTTTHRQVFDECLTVSQQLAGRSAYLKEVPIPNTLPKHYYELANGFYEIRMKNTLSLRAERQNDGRRTFKLVEGEPLPTSYGADLYKRIFKTDS
jgi:hypothetical protein